MHCCFDARQRRNLKNNATSTLNVLQQKFRKTTRIKEGRYVNRQTLRGLENVSYSERMNMLGLETLNRRRVIFDLILCYKHLHGLVEINNCNFVRIYQSSRTRGNGMKLYKEQCNIDARNQFFSNRIVDMWNSLPAAVVLSPSVAVLNEI